MPKYPTPALLRSDTRAEIDLCGRWSFALDPDDAGEAAGWPERDLEQTIEVPGSWEEQGFGEPAAEFIGGWTKRRSYEGVAWYSRAVDIPADWDDRRVWLQLDRVGWQSRVWVDGVEAGTCDSLSTPHRFDLTAQVRAGTTAQITIRVDNALDGVLNYESHIHSRHTATVWGGIVGPARLVATPRTWIEDVQVTPDVANRSIRATVTVAGDPGPGQVDVVVRDGGGSDSGTVGEIVAKGSVAIRVGDAPSVVALDLVLGADARPWSQHDPFLYGLEVRLRTEPSTDSVRDRFGLRTVGTDGAAITLNGEPVFLRGYVDCCIFPLTGYPPADKDSYARQFAIAAAYGFNHVRLHSWTPPREFFEAADEAGILVQSELPNWGNCNDPGYLAVAGDYLRTELDRVIPYLQRHPSLIAHSMGNELLQSPPHGGGMRYSPFLNELVRHGREVDPTRLYIDQSGFGYLPEEAERETDVVILQTFRGSAPDSSTTWWHQSAGARTPVIVHEHTQLSMYPRLVEKEKFTGIMEPSWLKHAEQGLASKGLLNRAEEFVHASGALQVRCLKELFERVRRTPGLAGIQMLNLTDFPGQGSALTGVLDVFWDSKGHVSPDEFRRFNDDTVILLETPRRTYPSGAWFTAQILISHHGRGPVGGELTWRITGAGGEVAAGRSEATVEPGQPWLVTQIQMRLPNSRSDPLTLEAEFRPAGTSTARTTTNSWDLWVISDERSQGLEPIHARHTLGWLADYYPTVVPDVDACAGRSGEHEGAVFLTDRLHVRYVDAVLNGATLVWLAENDDLVDSVTSSFEPLFWSFLWFPEQPNQTMGLVVRDHPLLSDFPHDGTADWQWFHLVDGATAFGLDALSVELEPIVEGVDNVNRAKRLGYLIEARIGRGRALITTLRLLEHYRTQPEAVHLLDAILGYVRSGDFAPKTELSLAQLWSIPRYPVGWSHP